MKFALQFNGPHNLLIVYYAGHGSYDDRADKLELHAYVMSQPLCFFVVSETHKLFCQIRRSNRGNGRQLSRKGVLEYGRETVVRR